MNDITIIDKVLSGDKDAFAVLVDKYKDISFTIALRIVQDRVDAEEVVQEAFIKAYTKLGLFRQESSFSTWLYRIVYNGAVSCLRKRKKKVSVEEWNVQGHVTEEPGYEEKEEEKFKKGAVHWAISQLKSVDRTIVTLFYNEDKSLKEIAEIMDLHEDTVKMRLFRSRRTMKKLLQEKYVDEFAETLQ